MDRSEMSFFVDLKRLEDLAAEEIPTQEGRKVVYLSVTTFKLLDTAVKCCIDYDGIFHRQEGECNLHSGWCPFARKYLDHHICDKEDYQLKLTR